MPKPSRTNLAAFFDSLELARIVLIQSSSWRAKDVGLPAKVNMAHKVAITGGVAGSLSATCRYEFEAVPDQGTEVQMKISVTYSVLYTAQGKLDRAMRGLVADNATLATWPFVRQLVRSVTAEMGLAPLDIGLYKVKFKANNLASPVEKSPAAKPTKDASTAKRSSKH